MVECQLPKLNVAGSNPVTRLIIKNSAAGFDELQDLRSTALGTTLLIKSFEDYRPCFRILTTLSDELGFIK